VDVRETSWSLIDSAREGDATARERFAVTYEPVVRAYYSARWARSPLSGEADDAVQEVFIDCLRERGALERTDPSRPFRPFLFGVARTVALRFEQRRGRNPVAELEDDDREARETRLSIAFDRAFAQQIMREATARQRELALAAGGVKQRRVELLQLRFQEGLTIAQIAERWGEDPARVHHLYADAREDFRVALREIVQQRNGGLGADLDRECEWMLEVLRRSQS